MKLKNIFSSDFFQLGLRSPILMASSWSCATSVTMIVQRNVKNKRQNGGMLIEGTVPLDVRNAQLSNLVSRQLFIEIIFKDFHSA